MPNNIQLAPPEEMLYYLAIFRRAFLAIEEYTRAGDKQGMLLGGRLTDALHNVPSLFLHYSDDRWNSPQEINTWLQIFPGVMQRRGAPERLVVDCKRIVSRGGEAQALGLQNSLYDLNFPPIPSLMKYLNTIYRACLSMRIMLNYGGSSPSAWEGLDQIWTERAYIQATFNGTMASVLCPLLSGLVRWHYFDEARFRKDAIARAASWPVAHRKDWCAFFTKKQG